MARRRTNKRTRRNPIRTTGALIINPRRRKRTNRRRTRRNALQIRTNRKRRTNRRRTRRNALQIRSNRRRSTRRNTRRRRNTRARRRNGTRRGMRRKTARRAYSRRRNGTRKGMRRRTARRAYAKRRNRKTRKNMGTMLKKIPLIGGALSSMVSLAPTALFGAVMVEPTMMAAKLLGRYVPNLPAPLFYAFAGLVVAAIVKSKFIPLAPSTKDKLAIAAASAAGGVAYYKFRTSGGAPESTAEEVGALELRGYSGPFGMLELRGNSGFAGASAYGEYGPAAVMPLGTY